MVTATTRTDQEEIRDPLILQYQTVQHTTTTNTLFARTRIESKKLWSIVGPSICTRLAMYGMTVVTLAFVGHLGDIELAAVSEAVGLILMFNFALLLGMATALETLCGQAYGAKTYHMLGIYMQRSWIVLVVSAVIFLPTYIFATPILKALGQTEEISDLAGRISIWLIPIQFSYALLFPMQRFLQCQLKNIAAAVISVTCFVVQSLLTWLLMSVLDLGLVGGVISLNLGTWLPVLAQYLYIVYGGCPQTWNGFSTQAFSGLWEYTKLSLSSGVMLCLELWYYRVLIILAGISPNAEIAVDALSVCLNINTWEFLIHVAFLAGTGVRVANELGAGNGNAAKFATIVSALQSFLIGLFFWVVVMLFSKQIALIFTSSSQVIEVVSQLAVLLAFTILLNSIQPILSGVAIGAGWQARVAYVNIGCYYLVGVPLGLLLGLIFGLGVLGIWGGMIAGTALQTLVLAFMTSRCDWGKEAENAVARVDKYGNSPPKNIMAPCSTTNGSTNIPNGSTNTQNGDEI